MLRATMAVCEVLPPTSVTKPLNTLRLKLSMSAGAMSQATSTKGSSPPKSCTRSPGAGTAEGTPRRRVRSKRSTTCSRSALRSRR